MKSELYPKLVDMYAGRELPLELDGEMSAAAFTDPRLAADMATLRSVVDTLHSERDRPYTEESRQRILRRLFRQGIALEAPGDAPAHYQYALPIQG